MSRNNNSITRADIYLARLFSSQGISLPTLANTCVVTFNPGLLALVKQKFQHQAIDLGFTAKSELVICHSENGALFTVAAGQHGAPMAAVLLEELIALGIKNFLVLGAAGHPCEGHDMQLDVGDLVLPTGAVIMEGTSQHYAGNTNLAQPSDKVVDRLREALNKTNTRTSEGLVATTDAFYRETTEMIHSLVKKQVLAVDMELSALFTIGQFYQCHVAGLLYISDVVSAEGGWRLGMSNPRLEKIEEVLLKVALEFCAIPGD